MDQGLEITNWMTSRVRALERQNARASAYTEPNYQWDFRASPTCPPTTAFHARGGMVWGDPSQWNGASWYVSGSTYDMADIGDSGDAFWFSNPYYYIPAAVMLRWSGTPGTTPPLYIITGSAEYATAAQAEEAAYPAWPGGAFMADAALGIPFAILVMRNNGNTTLVNQYQPIDRVNRGRSYIFKNLKMRFQW